MKIAEFGSEFDWNSNDAFLQNQDDFFSTENLQKFRSGRDALKAVALFYRDQIKTVLLPVLCCESMVTPFLMNGFKVVFYKINSNYTADIDDVEKKIEHKCIFLYMSYFGIESIDISQVMRWKRNFKIIAIEDTTQNVLIKKKCGEWMPDITISSIRKWAAIPDGAFLWSTDDYQDGAISDVVFSNLREKAMKMKSLYLSDGTEALKDTYLSMFQSANRLLDESLEVFSISKKSEGLLRQIDFNKISDKRKLNVQILKQKLTFAKEKKLLSFITNKPEKSLLYFPIMVDKRDEIQRVLAREKIYCPVIWPLPRLAKQICDVAEFTAEHMLALPCDQRYCAEDMTFISDKVMEVLMKVLENG